MKKTIYVIIFVFLLAISLISPQKSLADESNPPPSDSCQTKYDACVAQCANDPTQSGPGRAFCALGCNYLRVHCAVDTPSAVQKYCQDHPDDCKTPTGNGQLCNDNGIQTAIGCIPTELDKFIPAVIRYAYAIGGGIALLLMILGAFQMITSAGNPEAIKKGREQFIAAASGLVFILLSTVLLRIIGVDILAIPGF